MELLEGETLRDRLTAGPLPTGLASETATQIARGLAAAHERGIVHRDLKPENVYLTNDGLVKVLDFGLARHVVEEDRGPGDTASPTLPGHTTPGTVLGTAGYMAPEQVRGQAADARADVFAFGALLYEMLAGARAFPGGTAMDAMVAIVRDEPKPLPAGEPLAAIALRCLEKEPGRRFSSGRDLVAALQGSSVSSAASVASRVSEVAETSIAVLPFRNVSGNPESEYFSDGITEDIINALMKINALRVAARTSSFAFKGQSADVRQIGERLGVRHVLEGSVRQAGGRLRVTAQLIDVSNGYQLWSERWDRNIEDVFAVQDEIARALAETLEVRILQDSGAPFVSRATRSAEAYDLYLKGRFFFNRRAARQAIAKFEEAIALDPGYAPAYTGLSDSYGIHAFYGGIDTRVAYARARAAADRARELAPESAEVNVSMGIIEHYFGWDFEREERELTEAMRRNPRAGASRYWLGLLHGLRGNLAAALPLAREAARLDPLSAYAAAGESWPLMAAGRFEEAREAFRKGLEIDPNALLPLYGLGRCEQELGRPAEAIAAAEKAAGAAESRLSLILGGLAQAYAFAGRVEDARRVLGELELRAKTEYVAPLHIAPVLVALGDFDAAFAAFDRAITERNALAWFYLLYEPGSEPLRKDPRFPALAARVKPAEAEPIQVT